jgi:hypothetical protein
MSRFINEINFKDVRPPTPPTSPVRLDVLSPQDIDDANSYDHPSMRQNSFEKGKFNRDRINSHDIGFQ